MIIWISALSAHIGYNDFKEDDFINVRIKEQKDGEHYSTHIKERGIAVNGIWETKKNKVKNIITRLEAVECYSKNEWIWFEIDDGDSWTWKNRDGSKKRYKYYVHLKKIEQKDRYGRLQLEDLGIRLEITEFVKMFDFVRNPVVVRNRLSSIL